MDSHVAGSPVAAVAAVAAEAAAASHTGYIVHLRRPVAASYIADPYWRYPAG